MEGRSELDRFVRLTVVELALDRSKTTGFHAVSGVLSNKWPNVHPLRQSAIHCIACNSIPCITPSKIEWFHTTTLSLLLPDP